jgi:hypothetical protein
VSPVKYELGFYIPEDAILHSPRRENVKSYMTTQFTDSGSLAGVWTECGPAAFGEQESQEVEYTTGSRNKTDNL